MNELRAPATVAQTIDVLVYFSFCDDYELAIPGINKSSASGPDAPLAPTPFVPQYSPPDKLQDGVIGGYVCPSFDMGPSRTCIGETFTSIKQLLNKYTILWSADPLSTGSGFININPFVTNVSTIQLSTGVISTPTLHGDALSIFACGYALMRGGVKIAMSQSINTNPALYGVSTLTYVDTTSTAVTYVTPATDVSVTYGDPVSKLTSMVPVQFHDPSPFHEIAVPFYNATHASVVQVTEGAGYPVSVSQPRTRVSMGYPGASAYTVNFSRSCSDEFQLAYFLGFPPVLSAMGSS